MSRSAQRIQIDFVRLAGEEAGTLYFEQLLQRGFNSWPAFLQRRYPALTSWQGIAHLEERLKQLSGASADSHVLFANRSAELMKLAAKIAFGRCKNVLTTDLSWPNYQRILRREADRSASRVTRIPLRRRLLCDHLDCQTLIRAITDDFVRYRCDGLFLPAVDNLGVGLPISEIVRSLKAVTDVRFVVIDGAQALGHVPLRLRRNDCDLFLAGCHKWLRAYNPMGLAFYGHPGSQEYVKTTACKLLDRCHVDDPLLRFVQDVTSGTWSRYGETVNLLPLFSCQGAVDDMLCEPGTVAAAQQQRIAVSRRLDPLALNTSWRAVRPAACLRTSICLMRSTDEAHRQMPAQELRCRFHQLGLSVTAYRHGLVRFSMPHHCWSRAEKGRLQIVLQNV